MSGLWNALALQLWWPIQIMLLGVLLAGLFMLAVYLFGWERVRPWVLKLWVPAAILLAAFGLTRKSQQEGYAARKVEEKQAQEKAEKMVEEKRQDVRNDTDAEIDSRLDRWTK